MLRFGRYHKKAEICQDFLKALNMPGLEEAIKITKYIKLLDHDSKKT